MQATAITRLILLMLFIATSSKKQPISHFESDNFGLSAVDALSTVTRTQ